MQLRRKISIACAPLLAVALAGAPVYAAPNITMGGMLAIPATSSTANFSDSWGAWEHSVASQDTLYLPLVLQPENVQAGGGSNTSLTVTAYGVNGTGAPTANGFFWTNLVTSSYSGSANGALTIQFYSSGNIAEAQEEVEPGEWEYPPLTHSLVGNFNSVTLPPNWDACVYVMEVGAETTVTNFVANAQ